MHELSIAMSIVDMAQEEAERRNVQVDAVHLDLGALSGVVKEALLFSYGVACDGTLLKARVWLSQTSPSRSFVQSVRCRGSSNPCSGFAAPNVEQQHLRFSMEKSWSSPLWS